MLTVLSPAKKLSKECFVKTNNHNLPQFLDDSVGLVKELKKMPPPEYMSLMGISENLAELNWERMQEWNKTFTPDNSREAIFSFMGDTYSGLDAESLTNQDLEFAQNNVRILSGLYGLLRPLDLMKPYRLEMGTNFAIGKDKNLYEFWRRKITDSLNSELNEAELFIDLASEEYSSVVDKNALKVKTITPKFKDFKNGKLKIISFYAKKARGLMVRYIIDKNVQDYKSLLDFNYEGYAYSEKYTQLESEPVFVR